MFPDPEFWMLEKISMSPCDKSVREWLLFQAMLELVSSVRLFVAVSVTSELAKLFVIVSGETTQVLPQHPEPQFEITRSTGSSSQSPVRPSGADVSTFAEAATPNV